MEMLMKPQLCVSSNATEDYLRYLRQMNICLLYTSPSPRDA